MAKVAFKGGNAVRKAIKSAKAMAEAKGYDIGFFASATYPDGTPVAMVAVYNEFGTEQHGKEHTPERPFFRNANDSVGKKLVKVIRNAWQKLGKITRTLVGKLGMVHQNEVQKSIIDLKEPPNAPFTIWAKKGKANPLIDTGTMLRSVTYKVEG